MTRNPTPFCSRCHTGRPPLYANHRYTCVLCGKSRNVEEFRLEIATMRAAPPRVVARPVPVVEPPVKPAAEAAPTCGWAGCDAPPRSNSKYCSRNCSNRNARMRHKRRNAA